MELGKEVISQDPIVFDVGQIPEDWGRGDEKRVKLAFVCEKVALENPVHNAVALAGGIDPEGKLDMQMVVAAEQAAEYLKDKQGQPVVWVDVARDPENRDKSLVFLNGFIGISGQDEVFHRAGICVEEGYTGIHGYTDNNGRYRSQYLTDMDGTALSLASQTLRIGYPGYRSERDELDFTQELVAGEDIVPWIIDTLGDDEGYELYMNIVFSLLRHDHNPATLDSMIERPFAESARREYEILQETQSVLQDYAQTVETYRRIIEGETAKANLALEALGRQFTSGRIPRTFDSYSNDVTEVLNGVEGPKILQRLSAIDFSKSYISKLVTRIAHKA